MPGMYRPTTRSIKKWTRAFARGLFLQNPVLTAGTGLFLVLLGSVSVAGAAILSLLMVTLTIPVCVLCWLAGKWIAPWLRLPLAFVLSAFLYLPPYIHLQQIYPETIQALGLCGILAVADSLLLMRAFSPENRPLPLVLAEALGSAAGFSVVLLLLSVMWLVLQGIENTGGGSFSRAHIALGLIATAFLAAFWQYGIGRYQKKKGKGTI